MLIMKKDPSVSDDAPRLFPTTIIFAPMIGSWQPSSNTK
jgi:hypothetical protein